MEKKKQTRKQIERKIENAIVFVPKDKDTKSVWFGDKGLRITITDTNAVIETGFHRHVFENYTNSGVSRPWLYAKRVVEIANDYLDEIVVDGECSYNKLIDVLKATDEKEEYYIAMYFSWYVYNITMPLYEIGESRSESFFVYESYIHNIARNAVILQEKTEDMTNKQFLKAMFDNMNEYVETLEEDVLFEKQTDEEIMQENIEAAASLEAEDAMIQEI